MKAKLEYAAVPLHLVCVASVGSICNELVSLLRWREENKQEVTKAQIAAVETFCARAIARPEAVTLKDIAKITTTVQGHVVIRIVSLKQAADSEAAK